MKIQRKNISASVHQFGEWISVSSTVKNGRLVAAPLNGPRAAASAEES